MVASKLWRTAAEWGS